MRYREKRRKAVSFAKDEVLRRWFYGLKDVMRSMMVEGRWLTVWWPKGWDER